MKPRQTTRSQLPTTLIAGVLAAVPFHAFITVWVASWLGHYTLLRLWDDVALLGVTAIVTLWLVREPGLRKWLGESLLVRLIGAYAALLVLLGLVSLAKGDVSPKALGYGLLIDLRFLVWFLVVLVSAQRNRMLTQNWKRLLLAPVAVVIVFGVLQYVALPHNFLVHFGYHTGTTIPPIETINHNSRYIRVQSTLRGANPLGAYLVVVLSALVVLFLQNRRRFIVGTLGVLGLFALYASGSRSAWIGTGISLVLAAWFWLPTKKSRVVFATVTVAAVVLAGGAFMALKNNTDLQNAVLHTQTNSSVKTTSNDAHARALKDGLHDVVSQPLGDGPGTAGPASQYNNKGAPRIAEDYYIQVAQEAGWLGLAVFITIVGLVAAELYQLRGQSPLALTLLIALAGVSFVNLLSHAWADDTLAFLWWGLAGLALGGVDVKKAGQ